MCNWAIWRRRIEILMEKRGRFFASEMMNNPHGPTRNEIQYSTEQVVTSGIFNDHEKRSITYGDVDNGGQFRLTFPPCLLDNRYWNWNHAKPLNPTNNDFWIECRIVSGLPNGRMTVFIRNEFTKKGWLRTVLQRWRKFVDNKKRSRAAGIIQRFYYNHVLPYILRPGGPAMQTLLVRWNSNLENCNARSTENSARENKRVRLR